MRVLVTGAAGMLGRDLVAHLEGRHEVTAVDLEVDVTDAAAVRACVAACRPQAVFHLAAWTDVDGAEDHEAQAARGQRRRAPASWPRRRPRPGRRWSCRRPTTSSTGARAAPYDEDDAPAPLGAYGRTKLAGERAALARHPGGTRVARTAWLYGAGGRNFVDTMRRLGAEREEVDVVDDQTGSPTWTRDLAPALEALARPARRASTTPPARGAVTWAGLARAVFEGTGCRCRVRPVTTEAFGRPAPRPRCSALVSARPGAPRLRDWREALADYLEERA